MQTRTEFIAQGRTEEEVAKEIGADSLTYQDVDDMIATAQAGNPNIKHFCTACFTGEYPTQDITKEMFEAIEQDRKKEEDDEENPTHRK